LTILDVVPLRHLLSDDLGALGLIVLWQMKKVVRFSDKGGRDVIIIDKDGRLIGCVILLVICNGQLSGIHV
jgi:hypothetical protein